MANNPFGSGQGSAKPVDLIANPNGGGPIGGPPFNPLNPGKMEQQPAGDFGIDPKSIPSGGRFPQADPPPRPDVGTRPGANEPRPFKLTGG